MRAVGTCRMAWVFALLLALPVSHAAGQFVAPMPDFEVVFTPEDGKRWRAPEDACYRFRMEVQVVSDVLECKKLCASQSWCRGFVYQEAPSKNQSDSARCQIMDLLQPGETDVSGLYSYSVGATSEHKLPGSAIVYSSNTDGFRWCRGYVNGFTNDKWKDCTYPRGNFYDIQNTTSVHDCAQKCFERFWCNGFNYKHGQDWRNEKDFHLGACQMVQLTRPCTTGVTNVTSYVFQRDHFVTTTKQVLPALDDTAGAAVPDPTLLAVLSGILVQLGISATYLLERFPLEAQEATGLQNPNFYDMCPVLALGETGKGFRKICPRDGRPNCSIVDALPLEHHSPTTHFVSWCWHYTLEVVVSGVQLWAQSSSSRTAEVFLWMCFFCNNQYRIQDGTCSNSNDLSTVFEARLSSARNMLVILDTFLTPHYYKRAWCLFETFICLRKKFPMTVILPPKELTTFKQVLETSPWRVRDSFLQIDLQNAEASVEADAVAIKDLVHNSCGFDVVNTMVKEEFMSWLMRAFQEYVKGTIQANDPNVWHV